jgi:nucleotide-binding universal stress UspA family protein
LGSVAAKVLHSAKCPIWTDSIFHPRPQNSEITKILCAVELTEEAVPLLRYTHQLATKLGASVRLIHSVPELDTRPNRYLDFDLHRYLTESARVELSKLQREAGTEFPLTISETGIPSSLGETAREYGADLVVIGRGKAQKPLGRFQSHAYDIIRYAPSPVLSYAWPQGHVVAADDHLYQVARDSQLISGSPNP